MGIKNNSAFERWRIHSSVCSYPTWKITSTTMWCTMIAEGKCPMENITELIGVEKISHHETHHLKAEYTPW